MPISLLAILGALTQVAALMPSKPVRGSQLLSMVQPSPQARACIGDGLSRSYVYYTTAPARLRMATAQEPPANPFSLSEAWKRIKASYAEGYNDTRATFVRRKTETLAPGSLRPVDCIGALMLGIVLVEAASFGVALGFAWLLGASAEFASSASVNPQVRLQAALGVALVFRAHTRLWRLLAELVAVAFAADAVARRPVDARPSFVADRAKQALALLMVLALTLRAMNRGWLAGSVEPAATVLASKATSALASVFDSPLLAPLGQWLSPMARLAEQLALAAWAAALGVSAVLCSWDVWASSLPPIAALKCLAELEETLLLPPVRFLADALHAAYLEVLAPGLKRLGWLTAQTLG
jgi:hypothetical protein